MAQNIPSKYNLKKRKNRGSSAVEFAMIAAPFFFLLFAILEVMTIFIMQTTMESALSTEARKIRTGQAQSGSSPITQSQFKANICTKLMGLGDCTNRLFVMVQAMNTAPGTALPTPWADGSLTPGSADDEPYQNSTQGQIVIVRAYYMWPIITPGLNGVLSNYSSTALGNYNRVIVATSAFKNEPF